MQVNGKPLFANEQEVKEIIEQLKEKGIMQVNGKPLFANEQEVKEIIEQLKEKGIMRSNVGYTINGFRGKYRSMICPKVFYHLYRIWI
jgi:predicted transcriptional regulator YheO